jgi:hypothetical protein
MTEVKNGVKTNNIARKGLAARVVVAKEGRNDALREKLAKLADKMNKDISTAPNEIRVRMW